MKKKKFGLVTWSLLAGFATLLTIAGFIFGFLKEGVGVYHTAYEVAEGMYLVDAANFFRPFVDAFGSNIGSACMIYAITYIAVVAVVVILLVIIAAIRKNWKYLAHLLPIIIIAFVGLYLSFLIGAPVEGGASYARQFLSKSGALFDIFAGKYNTLQPVFAWLTAIAAVITVIATIGYIAVLFDRVSKKNEKAIEAKPEEEAKVSEATAPVAAPVMMTPAQPVEETKTEDKPKRKVFLVVKKYEQTGETIKPVEEEKTVAYTEEDISAIVRKEIAANMPKQPVEEPKPVETCECECKKETKCCESSTKSSVCTTETRTCGSASAKKEENGPVRPIIIAIPDPVIEEDEEKPVKKEPAQPKAPKAPKISREEFRAIVVEAIKAELENILRIPETTEEVTVEEVAASEEIAPAVETVAVLNEENVPVEVTEEPAKPAEAPAKPSEPIERISFAERMRNADPEMKENYNRIKSLLLSYGLKNRVSNGGDAFRLHKVTYAKICVAGKSLKIYMALDPNDYKNSTLPIKDASSKAMYREIPLVFKVKSGLSMRRCEQLIGEMMDKHHIEQVDRVHLVDYVAKLEENTDDEE